MLIEAQSPRNRSEFYLNRIYLGAGVYGVETMSQHLFRKTAAAVTLPEAAFIAGLIRAPSALSPWSNYERALERSHVVLAQMRDQGLITAPQYEAARQVRPRIQPYRQPNDVRAGFAKEFLRQQFRNEFGGDNPPDWQVHTTCLPAIQDAAERAVASGLDRRRPGLEAATDVVDPSTGDILAMVGGANFARSSYNRAVRSRRHPASAFMPFVLAAALPRTTRRVRPHEPAPCLRAGRSRMEPAQRGEQPTRSRLRAALLESNNPAAADRRSASVRARSSSWPAAPASATCRTCRRALGTGVVSPLDLTSAYTMFPGGGQVARPRGMISVFDSGGRQVFDQPINREQLISPAVAFQMTSMLRDVIERGTGASARTLGVRGPVAGKTGTTDDYHDAWFVGYSTSVVVGVWVGFDQPASIGREAYGARIALPIWADFMKRTARQLPASEFVVPPGIHAEELCSVLPAPVDAAQSTGSSSRTATPCRPRLPDPPRLAQASRAFEGFFLRVWR